MIKRKYLLAWFSDDPCDPNFRYITEEGLGSSSGHEGKWFSKEEVKNRLKDDPTLFVMTLPYNTLKCRSFT